MASRTQRISQYSFEQALKAIGELQGKLQKLPSDALGDLAKDCASKAADNFSDAYYAGPQEYIDQIVASLQKPRKTAKGKWSVTASGVAVKFIEFGTGVEGKNSPYEGNLPSGYRYDAKRSPKSHRGEGDDSYWFFAPTGDMDNAYGVERARKKSGYSLASKNGERVRTIDLANNPEYTSASAKKKYGEWEEQYYNTKWYTTQGNPANNCLYFAFQDTVDEALPKLKEYMRK